LCAADALALSLEADLEEIGLPPAAVITIATHFGNANARNPLGPLEPLESELDEPEPAAPSGPIVGFDEAAVLAWLGSVPGLSAAQRAAVAEMMAEDEYNGPQLAAVAAKALGRLLKGTAAEDAVPALLAARDADLAAEEEMAQRAAVEEAAAAAAAAEAAAVRAAAAAPQPAVVAAEAPSCSICLEPYSATAGVVPRMLRCGHDFCEGCLDRMLEPDPPARKRKKRLECPSCRKVRKALGCL
jgi:hypothetical protein